MRKENWYVAPQVEVLEVQVEKGFAASGSNENVDYDGPTIEIG